MSSACFDGVGFESPTPGSGVADLESASREPESFEVRLRNRNRVTIDRFRLDSLVFFDLLPA